MHDPNTLSKAATGSGSSHSNLLDTVAIEPWPTMDSRLVGDFRIFRIRSDLKINPRTRRLHDFYAVDCADWVNVLAITPTMELVMVEQFRHGTNTIELEIPGGMLDPNEIDPVAAGIRELREETGYVGETGWLIGKIFPNAALFSNRCFTLLVQGARLQHAVELDSGEDIATRRVPLADLETLMASGKIQHALVAVALYHLNLWQRGLIPAEGIIHPESGLS